VALRHVEKASWTTIVAEVVFDDGRKVTALLALVRPKAKPDGRDRWKANAARRSAKSPAKKRHAAR